MRETVTNFKLRMGSLSLVGRGLPRRSPGVVESFLRSLPLTGRAVQDAWSGEVLRLRGVRVDYSGGQVEPAWFMYPGLVGLDLAASELVVCYGQGRLSDGRGPIPMLPLGELTGDLGEFCDWGVCADSRGAVEVTVEPTRDAPQEPPRAEESQCITVHLGRALATVQLLTATAPLTSAALLRRLPLEGTGTNTIFSGPLVRFWNSTGGPNGETPLEERGGQYELSLAAQPQARTRVGRNLTVAGEAIQDVLYPGYLYYLPRRPWRGIRIAARDATRMGSGLVPFARFVGDWNGFAAVAATLLESGALPMSFQASS